MLTVAFKRITKSGFINFWRNGFVSLSSLSIMAVTLVVLGILMFASALFNASLLQLKDKVDINIYFSTSAPEDDILALKKNIDALPEVKETKYLSREMALEAFKVRHANDELTLNSINELGDNPLSASLTVKTREPSQYESVAKFLESKTGIFGGTASIISKTNYYDNKTAIDSLNRLVESAKKIGFAVVSVFVFISILITFNTIRLVIYMSREEISVMRLVGASTRYIGGPFIVTGMMYGAISGIVALIILYGLSIWLAQSTEVFFGGINLVTYYLHNFFEVFVVIIGSGVVLGALGSALAVRRYLTI